jgi:3-hexulose-6-phosphate synthase / 6-phospho-3-hexuloisomerase
MIIAQRRYQLQLALDVTDIERALRICEQTADSIDIFEAGTPLIKATGISAVKRIRQAFPGKQLVADMKTIDTGALDAAMAFEAGADAVIVQAAAPHQTVRAVVEESRRQGKICMVDSLGINDMIRFERIVSPSGADYGVVHTGIDEQRDGFRPLERLKRVVDGGMIERIAVAGGIDAAMIRCCDDP